MSDDNKRPKAEIGRDAAGLAILGSQQYPIFDRALVVDIPPDRMWDMGFAARPANLAMGLAATWAYSSMGLGVHEQRIQQLEMQLAGMSAFAVGVAEILNDVMPLMYPPESHKLSRRVFDDAAARIRALLDQIVVIDPNAPPPEPEAEKPPDDTDTN